MIRWKKVKDWGQKNEKETGKKAAKNRNKYEVSSQWKKRKMFFVYLSSKHSEQQTLFKNVILCLKDMISDYLHAHKKAITHNTSCQEGMLLPWQSPWESFLAQCKTMKKMQKIGIWHPTKDKDLDKSSSN